MKKSSRPTPAAVRRWLEKAGANVFDSRACFKKQRKQER